MRDALVPVPDEGRYPEPGSARTPPLTIERALREHCHVPVRSYFLATVLEDGRIEYFSSSGRLPERTISRIFDMEQFMRCQRGDGSDGSEVALYGGGQPTCGMRNKTRRKPASKKEEEPCVVKKIPIRIGNETGVWEFYEQRFKNIQQTACKILGKAWVKAVAPKKQSSHPYTGSKIPDWWPKPWGPGKSECVRHKEPDHLWKRERVPLLVHILRLVVEPQKTQHPAIQGLNLNVAKFEDITKEALATWYSESAKNEKKRPYLKEVFKVARMEEQYKRGEIDGNVDVFVMPHNKLPDMFDSEEEEEEEEYDSDGHSGISQKTLPSHSIIPIAINSNSPTRSMSSAGSIMTLPPSGPQYTSAPLTSDMGQEHHQYADGSTPMQLDDTLPTQQDSSRRAPMFNNPPAEYPTSCVPQVLYPAATAGSSWHQTTTAPSNTSLYSFPQQQHSLLLPQSTQPQIHAHTTATEYVTHMDVQLGQQQYMAAPFNGLPQVSNLFRSLNGHGGRYGAGSYGQRDY
ncbi:hypothetical protein B0H66DRAFT_399897 [Apodospora peruviana]|uniref:Subtelomeric hrmA-associated cluster protein AFUB-079030/YDR124W-like helical bundle domain-containing protein n=1 Tax=Apodospora peruviana TaxID=516989 RepID=A0AAE0LYN3_9PEZI|nr:hypothetical protein B0H66DRAFT_399897 [Apodospora peruviana]